MASSNPISKQWSHWLWVCHRRPDRSFFYRGTQFPVCARCTGLWIGYVIGIILLIFWWMPWWLASVLIVPLVIDGSTQLIGWRESTNPLRLITGIIAGIGQIVLVAYMFSYANQLGYQLGLSLLN